MLLQEALRIFEDFITSIQILQKPLTEEEIEIVRNSIFKVAVALEVFALNYGKHQMIGVNSPVEINSRKLGESGHDHCYGFEVVRYLFIDWHNNQWHNGCFHDLTFDQWCSQMYHWPFIFINHGDYGQFFRRLECWKALKPWLSDALMIYRGLHLFEDCVRNT